MLNFDIKPEINLNWSPKNKGTLEERDLYIRRTQGNVNFIINKAAGKGRSFFLEKSKQDTRKNGGLYVDLIDISRGHLPYEQELARRYILNLDGPLPQELRRKKMAITTRPVTREPRRFKGKHVMMTSNGYLLLHEHLKHISKSLIDSTGIKLKLPQLCDFLGESDTDQFVSMTYKDAAFIDILMDELARKLINTTWPRYSEQLGEDFPEPINKLSDLLAKRDFANRLNTAALEEGYEVIW